MSINMSTEDNQVTIKDLKITGPLAGKKLEIQFDLKPIEEKKYLDKDKDKDKKEEKKQEKKQEKEDKKAQPSSDRGTIGLLFLLLFALIFLMGQTGGFTFSRYAETEIPSSYPYRYQPALR